jgi:hypothetical protein
MTNEQMELGLGAGKTQQSPTRRSSRATRAAWWFAQMRHVVQSAVDWPPAPEPPHEQVWFPGARREVKI